jgi:hypothetical protein
MGFDGLEFDFYKEDNCREEKKQKVDFQILYGRHIPLLPTATAG